MLVAIEGHSYSGKTTVANRLRAVKGATIIEEHDVYARGVENYPPFPPISPGMSEKSIDFFAKLEDARQVDISKLDCTSTFVCMDRTFLSPVLFTLFMKRLSLPGELHNYEYAKKVFCERASKGQVHLPDYLILLEPKDIDIYHARLERPVSVERLKTDQAYRFFSEQYRKVLQPYADKNRLIMIQTENSQSSLQEVVEEIYNNCKTTMSAAEKKELCKKMIGLLE